MIGPMFLMLSKFVLYHRPPGCSLTLFIYFASLGDPAGARLKPGSGYGYGFGIRVDSPLGPLRLEYAFNDKQAKRFHFGVGYRN